MAPAAGDLQKEQRLGGRLEAGRRVAGFCVGTSLARPSNLDLGAFFMIHCVHGYGSQHWRIISA